ncbi:WAP four-disulfide core domain protein 5 isoform X1 [Myotis daubentonii]|uniref:WAP four-disulfide core domain protein 5 isoform X1 n=1 Tax=Myotis daubentonii TaxID=98922 RepID=UPI00287389AF|nr:WAP four-disulfide core domain protein 5 isoform X1 [Myotis daubentonii]
MRAWSLLLLVSLLALGSQLPTVSGRRKGALDLLGGSSSPSFLPASPQKAGAELPLERHGGCPPDDGPCLHSAPDQCVDDSQCPSKMKCCHRSCFRQCVRRVTVKQGTCPDDHLRCLSPIQHLCHQDADCRGKSRCCLGACGRDCRNPVRG